MLWTLEEKEGLYDLTLGLNPTEKAKSTPYSYWCIKEYQIERLGRLRSNKQVEKSRVIITQYKSKEKTYTNEYDPVEERSKY